MGAVFSQIVWLVSVLAVLWFMILNKRADRFMCDAIGRFLAARTQLGQRQFHRLLQIGDNYSVSEHPLRSVPKRSDGTPDVEVLKNMGLRVLAVRRDDGDLLSGVPEPSDLQQGDALVVYGSDHAHEALEAAM